MESAKPTLRVAVGRQSEQTVSIHSFIPTEFNEGVL